MKYTQYQRYLTLDSLPYEQKLEYLKSIPRSNASTSPEELYKRRISNPVFVMYWVDKNNKIRQMVLKHNLVSVENKYYWQFSFNSETEEGIIRELVKQIFLKRLEDNYLIEII